MAFSDIFNPEIAEKMMTKMDSLTPHTQPN